MKSGRILLVSVVAALLLAATSTRTHAAIQTPYTIPTSDMLDAEFESQAGTLNSRSLASHSGFEWARFDLQWNGSTTHQLGDQFVINIPSANGGNLSAYDGYELVFHNPMSGGVGSGQPVHVNTFLNTGWTDAPFDETDRFYQNGWTFLWPSETKTLRIDFDSAETYVGGVNQGFTSVQNLNHVTNLGFQVSFPDPVSLAWAGAPAGDYQVDARPTPEPASLLVWCGLAAGVGGIAVRRRRRKT